MNFFKYQGTGNDFVMVNDLQRNFPAANVKLIADLCNRRFGIGADGLILLQQLENGDYYMHYFNSDGRESSMCGNGGRCFAQFIFDLGLAKDEVKFLAIDGWHLATKISENQIALQMKDVDLVKKLENNAFELNTGSPHFVQFNDMPLAQFPLVEESKKIRYNSTYSSEGINVNFLNLKGLKEVELRTYERGVEDETLSCGTGATAAALCTAIFNGLPQGKHQVVVQVRGGELGVKFHFHPDENTFSEVWLMGPAKRVFEGSVQT